MSFINKIKLGYNKIYKFFIILLFIVFIYFYITIFINTSIKYKIRKEIIYKYNQKDNNFFEKLIYSSLNKIVSFEDVKSSNELLSVNEIKKEESKKYNPIIYIYNTHENEKYSLNFVSDYSITPDVKIASLILKDHLHKYNIDSFIQTKSTSAYVKKNNLPYSGSYEASRIFMKNEMKNNDYKIFIDIHRDSTKYKYTLYKKDNKKYAKIMFVLSTKHNNYKENEKFVNYLNNKINKKYKGLSRGILKRKDVIFNQDLSSRAILIELGGVDNTIEEINNTLLILASIINEYIKEEKL